MGSEGTPEIVMKDEFGYFYVTFHGYKDNSMSMFDSMLCSGDAPSAAAQVGPVSNEISTRCCKVTGLCELGRG